MRSRGLKARRSGLVPLAVGLLLLCRPAHAIRPFITDDAHVVGKGNVQLETWWRRDQLSLQHWALPAFGPTDWIELTLGGVHGLSQLASDGKPQYAAAGPLVQGKFLLLESIPNKPPGVALVLGGATPLGRGGFESPGFGAFSYLAVTQAFFKEDDFLIHANVGVSTVAAAGYEPAKLTWGVGTQVETVYNLHLIGEVFSGDPYVQGAGGAFQAGIRAIFNEQLQLDATVGKGIWGDTLLPIWFTSGIRVVTADLF